MNQYDLIVVGSGPAGRRGAIQAAKLGKKVLVIEQGKRVGGVSVHTGTIPSKTLRETALNLTGWRERGFYGRSYRVKQEISAEDLRRRLIITLNHEVEVLEHQFARNRVQHIRGRASFVGPTTLEISKDDDESMLVSGTSILLAVGTKPFRPDDMPFDGRTVVDSDELLDIQELPRSLVVIGAGVIGIEYATIFSALDIQVTVIDPKTTMLDFIDREIVEDFTYQLRDRAMKLNLGQKAEKVERLEDGKVLLTLDNGRKITTEMVLFAAGRMGATDALNLPAAGLEADARGRLKVNPETFQTTVPNIYAAGDVVGFPSSCFDLDGAGPRRGSRGCRRDRQGTAEVFPLRNLCRAGDLDLRPLGRRGQRAGNSVRMRPCALPGNLTRTYHGPGFRPLENDLFAEDTAAAGRTYHR